MSGETAAAGAPRLSLATISKPLVPGRPERVARDPLDRGERRRLGRQPRQKALDGVGAAPSTSSSTPRSSFSTQPPSPSSVASRKT